MPSTMCVLPILAALFTANNFVDIKDVHWNTANTKQQILTQNYWPNRTDLDLLHNGEIKSQASDDVTIVNQFLRDNNFSIQLTDLHNSRALYIASILNVALEWETQGTKTTLEVEDKEYPAVKFDTQKNQLFRVCYGAILEIKAKNGDFVYMMKADKETEPFTGFALLNKIQKDWQRYTTYEIYYPCEQAFFPMVDINEIVDISWLENLQAYSEAEYKYEIAQALQQTKFQMSEKGVKVESAAAISIKTICCPCVNEPFKIDDSFYLWIVRPGMQAPVFAAYIDKESWKAPAE